MMPGFDRRGPMGQGVGTGWGRGLCATGTTGRKFSGGFVPGMGRGGRPWGGGLRRCFGGRMGGGGGWFRAALQWFQGYSDPTQEADLLKADLEAAKRDVETMEARLRELENETNRD